jgi:hypothetical protein
MRADAELLSQTSGLAVDPQTIQFDSTDELCLDGEHLVRFDNGSGGPAEYRTRRDAFAKILVDSVDPSLGPNAFTVFRKDGTIQHYGSTADSRIDTTRSVDDPSDGHATTQSVRAAWYLAEVDDRYGNTMSITYINRYTLVPALLPVFGGLSFETEAVPDEIDYTSNTNTGRTANKSVKFNYVDKQNVGADAASVAGWTRLRAKLLASIDVKGPNPVQPGLIREYRMSYMPFTLSAKETLYRVTVCDGASVRDDGHAVACESPTGFEWSPGGTAYVKTDTGISDAANDGSTGYPGSDQDLQYATRTLHGVDMDGDGRDDLIYRRNVPFNTAAVGDPSHDPKILIRMNTSHLGIPSFGAPLDPQFPVLNGAEWADNSLVLPYLPTLNVLDLDGDGIVDLAIGGRGAGLANSPFTFDIFMGTTTPGQFNRLPIGVTGAAYSDQDINPEFWEMPQGPMVAIGADLTGDGRPEFIRAALTSSDYRIAYRTNSSAGLGKYTYATLSNPQDWQQHPYWHTVVPIDVDGDGKAELLNLGTTNQGLDPHYSVLSIGSGATTSRVTPIPGQTGTQSISGIIYPHAPVKLIDYNGDGLKDIMVYVYWDGLASVGTYQLWMNTGTSFVLANTFNDFGTFEGVTTDFDGDGREDSLYIPCNGVSHPSVALSNGDGTFTAKELTDIAPPQVLHDQGAFSSYYCVSTVLDANGDGLPDIIQQEAGSTTLQLYTNANAPAGQLKTIVNGIGSRVDIQYSTVTPKAATCTFPEACGA